MANTALEKLDAIRVHVSHLKSVLMCINVIILMAGIALIALCMWLRFDPDVREWVAQLKVYSAYIGIYILIVAALLMIAAALLGCVSITSQSKTILHGNAAFQLLCFVIGLSGAAVLVDYSTFQSSIQPIIRDVMLSLINIAPVDSEANQILTSVQETMGCCGATGPNDYISLRRALPTQCRDSVTGNAYYYGCAEELSWYLEKRSSWIAAIACVIGFLNVINASLSLVVSKALTLEEQESQNLAGSDNKTK